MTTARARALVLMLLGALATMPLGAAGAPDDPGSGGTRDVRSFGAVCDGTTDTAAAFQAAYDALGVAGGTILVPGGATCAIGGAGVEPKSKVELRCERGARLRALAGARAMFRTGRTLDDWSVSGCDFDLNGVAVSAWESSGGGHGGARWSFRDNTVHGMPPTAGEPITSVRLDCTLAEGPCLIANNTIFGSESAPRRDTCLTVTAGGFVGFNTQLLGNYIQGCGGDCLEVRPPGGITANDNVLVRCKDNAVDNSSLNSVWSGNQFGTFGEQAGAGMSIHDTIGNQVIVGNQFTVNPATKAPALYAVALADTKLAGLYIDDNYAAQGVWFDAKGACAGGSCGGETCDDDAGCGACGGRCTRHGIFDHDHVANLIVTGQIRIESATNLLVQGNVVIGNASGDVTSQLRFVNPRHDVPSGAIVVSGNQLSKRAAPSSEVACIEFDDVGGGGFAGVTITGNGCGQDGAITRFGPSPQGIRLTRPPQVWRSILIADNNLANAVRALVGFDSAALRSATRLSGNLGLGVDAAPPTVLTARTHADSVRADSATPTAAADLSLTLAAVKTYALDGVLRLRAADQGTGFASAFSAPQGATVSVVARAAPARADGSAVLGSGASATVALDAGDALVTLAGTVTTAATGGTLELRWAQGQRGPAPLVLQTGSWLRATELP